MWAQWIRASHTGNITVGLPVKTTKGQFKVTSARSSRIDFMRTLSQHVGIMDIALLLTILLDGPKQRGTSKSQYLAEMSFSATSALEEIHLEGKREHSCTGLRAPPLANRQIRYCREGSGIIQNLHSWHGVMSVDFSSGIIPDQDITTHP